MKKIIKLNKQVDITEIQGIYNQVKNNFNDKIVFDFKILENFDASFLQLLILINKYSNQKPEFKNISDKIKQQLENYGFKYTD